MITWPWARIPGADLSAIKQIYGEALKEIPIEAARAPSWEALWSFAQGKPRSLIMQAGEGAPYYVCVWNS